MLQWEMRLKLAVCVTAAVWLMTELCRAENAPVMGPFRMELRAALRCPPAMEGLRMFNVTVNTMTADPSDPMKYFMDGTGVVGSQFNNSLTAIVSFRMEKTKNKIHPLRKIRLNQACSAIISNLQFVAKIWKAAGVKTTCPVAPGTYILHNQTISLDGILIKEFIYGQWRMDVQVVNPSGTIWGCVRILMDTVPL